MEELIKQAFLHVDVIGPHVQAGHYDLLGPDQEIILPQVWDKVIEPDWAITMVMWPMDRARPAGPPGMHAMPGHPNVRPPGMGQPGAGVRFPPGVRPMAGGPAHGPPPPPPGMMHGAHGVRPGGPNIRVIPTHTEHKKKTSGKSSSSGFGAFIFGKPKKK